MATYTNEQIVEAYLNAEQALKQAEKAKENAKKMLEQAYAEHGIVTATANGKRVTLVTAERRNFDAQALAQLVSASVFAQVTKTTVDVKLFDLAREADAISEVTEVAVTRNTPYTAIKITNANEVAIAQVA